METLLQEYNMEFDLFLAEQEVNQQFYQIECGILNESIGLMTLNESVFDTIKQWFQKIMDGITTAIEKLRDKLTGLTKNITDSVAGKMNDPNRTPPETFGIKVTNYHTYDFNKLSNYNAAKFFNNTDYVQVVAGMVGGSGSVPNVKTDEMLKKVYPDLVDEKLSIFDKMRQNVLTSGKDNNASTLLTNDMLEDSWQFISKTYQTLIDDIKKDRDAVKNQKKNVDSVTQQIMNTATANKQPNNQNNTPAPIPNNPAQPNNESTFLVESYLILEAEKKDTGVKDQEISDAGQNGDQRAPSRETYAKAFRSYISLATQVISAKAKITNRAYIDKYKIVRYYCKKQDWAITPKKKKIDKDVMVKKKEIKKANAAK